ncbi:SPOC domain-like protein [Flammula alnicola]|nr:SPOC domain-like protein [Flammula alnicola]
MPAERAGYTVTMFLIDTSPSMGTIRAVDGENQSVEMTNLEWGLQFVKLKVQEMIFNGRKTDQCGVIVFGSEETQNIVNAANGGYENVLEYIPIAQPNASTIAKIDALQPSTTSGDPIDALIVGVETQARYLANKKTWTRKVVIVTDGESPIEVEDWEATVNKMDSLNVILTIVGIDFDDEELPYRESNKSNIKRTNEQFYKTLTSSMKSGIVGTCAYALQETNLPDIKIVRSVLMGTILRIGDVDARSDEALELSVKASKCTSLARPKSWKKFALRVNAAADAMAIDEDEETTGNAVYAQLKLRSEYYVDRNAEEMKKTKTENDKETKKTENLEKVEKEDLVRGFKYGTTYAPCPDGQFPKLRTRKGIDICGFFPSKNFRRELSMGEVQYIWADPSSPQQQVALSSIAKAMAEKKVMAIARWVSRDEMDPKMGVLTPVLLDNVDCLLWSQMPFADDVRKYTFASLDHLINKKGEVLTEHPYLPTEGQLEAMDKFVDAMDLMDAGDKDEEGNRLAWFDTTQSFNPAIHRVKQAMFHCAIVNDITTNPLPPPHPELTKYFEPPKRVLKRSRDAIEDCKSVFNIKEVPKRAAKAKKDGHAHAQDDDDNMLLLDRKRPLESSRSQMSVVEPALSSTAEKVPAPEEDSETEDEDEEDLLDKKKPMTPPAQNRNGGPLPTPARSVSPSVDPGRAPGRIIGNTYPLEDFQKNIAQGDVVTKAVEDLSAVIEEVVMRPFGSRRTKEMLECMIVLRKTCLEEDEIDAWNSFVGGLKEKCLSKPGNPDFWKAVQEVGRDLSLISKQEAKKYGGESHINENESGEVRLLDCLNCKT